MAAAGSSDAWQAAGRGLSLSDRRGDPICGRGRTSSPTANTFVCRENLGGGPFVALHIRGADKGGEDPDLERTNRSNFAALQGLGSEWKIFLLTDDENWLRRVRDAYGDRVVTTDCRRTAGTTGLHYPQPRRPGAAWACR